MSINLSSFLKRVKAMRQPAPAKPAGEFFETITRPAPLAPRVIVDVRSPPMMSNQGAQKIINAAAGMVGGNGGVTTSTPIAQIAQSTTILAIKK